MRDVYAALLNDTLGGLVRLPFGLGRAVVGRAFQRQAVGLFDVEHGIAADHRWARLFLLGLALGRRGAGLLLGLLLLVVKLVKEHVRGLLALADLPAHFADLFVGGPRILAFSVTVGFSLGGARFCSSHGRCDDLGGYCHVDEKLVDLPPRYWARARREPAILGIRNGHQPQLDNISPRAISNTSGAASRDPPPSGPGLIWPGRGTAPASTGPRSVTTPSPPSCAAIPRRSSSTPRTARSGVHG